MSSKNVFVFAGVLLGAVVAVFFTLVGVLISKDLGQLEKFISFPMADEPDFLGRG